MQEPSVSEVPARWDDLKVGRLQRRAETQQSAPLYIASVAASLTIAHFIRYAGRTWDSVMLTVTAGTSPVMTLQPQIVGDDGVTRDVGTPVLLTGRVFTSGLAVRCHDELRLGKKIPAGSTLLLKLTRSSGSLTNATFHFVTTGQ